MRHISNETSQIATLVAADAVVWEPFLRDHKGHVCPPPDCYGVALADTHCHLDMLPHPDLALAQAAVYGLRWLISVVDPSEDPEYSYSQLSSWQEQAAELLAQWQREAVLADEQDALADELNELSGRLDAPECQLIIGCHPHNATAYNAGLQTVLEHYLVDPRTVAIGEIGLDYHYNSSPPDVQRQVFRQQLELAWQYQLPVCLHLREAHADALQILAKVGWPPAGVLLHCFTLGSTDLQPFLEQGASVAIGGAVTFHKSEELQTAAAGIPLKRLLTETDAPFMTPEPLRGTLCGPAHTSFTAARLAAVRGLSSGPVIREFLQTLYQNAHNFFGREAPTTQVGQLSTTTAKPAVALL